MKYKHLELPEIKPGDIVLFRNEFEITHPMTFLSAAVRGFTEYPYNHCGVVVSNNGDLFINEALFGGITARPLEKYLERGDKTYIAILRPKQAVKPIVFSREANKYVGSSYDFTALVFHHSIYRIPKLLGITNYAPWIGSTGDHAVSKLVCSEYCALVHGLPNWWLMSTREVVERGHFDIIYQEKQFI